MLVSVSGAQSCGKSSVLEAIKLRSLGDIYVDGFKAARTCLTRFGESLDEIVKDAAKLIEFQTLVLEAKYDRDLYLQSTYKDRILCIFTERSMVDLAAFAETWKSKTDMKNLDVYASWVDSRYVPRCLEAQRELNYAVVHLPIGVFNHIDDGVRAKSDTQSFVDKKIREYSQSAPLFYSVNGSSIQERSDEIVTLFRNLMFPDGRIILR